MRNFKLKLFTILSALILSCSCFLFAPQEGIEVKADSQKDVNQTASKNFTLNDNFAESTESTSKSLEYKLYIENSDETSDYYTISVENFSVVSSSKTISKNSIYVKVGWGIEGTISTTIDVNNPNLQKAIDNGMLSIQLKTDFESHHTGSVTLSNGSNKSTKDGSTSSTQVVSDLITMSSYQSSVSFYAKGSTSFPVDYFVLDIKNPTITLTTTDVTAPTVAFANNLEWIKDTSREISFNVSDSESGIQKVEVYGIKNGSSETVLTATENDNKKTGSYSFTAKEGYDYYVKTWDNVNNVREECLITANQLRFDNSSSTLSMSMDSTIHSQKFGVTFNYIHDGLSPESTLYYRIVNGRKTEVSIDLSDSKSYKTLATADLSKMQSIAITDFFTTISNGITYTLMARTIDEVGNITDAVCSFTYDTRQYVSDITVIGGKVSGGSNGAETFDDFTKNTLNVWHNDYVEFAFENLDGYTFYKIWRYNLKENNGILEVDDKGNYIIDESTIEDITAQVDSNTFGYNCTANYGFVIKFRYMVDMTLDGTDFVYTADDSGNGVMQNIAYTLNNPTEENLIDTNLISIEYKYKDEKVDGLKDAGNYIVNWSIDTNDYIGSGEFTLNVNPKDIQLAYTNIEGLIYSGSEYQIGVDVASENVNEAEKEKIFFDIVCYLASDETKTPVALKNAGTYSLIISSTSANYKVINDTISSVVIAKKEVTVTISKSEFTYNANVQNIEYTLDDEIETSVEYGETFKDAKTYTYVIVPHDTNNYVLINAEGTATINKAEITFALDKTEYDYTGNEFTITDIKLASGSEVNGLYFEVTHLNGSSVSTDAKMLDAGLYTIVLKTTDLNYILNNTEFNVTIKITTITISVTNKYEYTGENIVFEYLAKNDRGEVLNVTGLSYVITKDGSSVDGIKSVGEYSYQFETVDPKFVLNGKSGTFEVVKAQIDITMGNLTFEYNEEHNYPVNFSAISKFGVDFTSKFKLVYLDDTTETTLTSAKKYGFRAELISADESIEIAEIRSSSNELLTSDDMIVTILPKKVDYTINCTYTYTGSVIDLDYAPVGEFEYSENVVVELGEMLNAGEYNGIIYSNNTNYYIYIDGMIVGEDYKTAFTVTVNKFVINVLPSSETDGVYAYTYNGSKIIPGINISLSDFDEYEIVAKINDEESEIINAGEYTVTLNSLNNNYEFAGECVVRVNPRKVTIVVDHSSLNQEYSKSLKTVSYAIYDGEEKINVTSTVRYYVGSRETIAIYAGQYSYKIEVSDSNYSGSLVSDDSTLLVVSKKTINVVATPGQQKVYGQSDIPLTYSIDGLCKGDRLDISLSRDEGESAGLYRINLDATEFDNYAINYVESYFKIAPKKLLIMVFDVSKVYGEADPTFEYSMYLDGVRVNGLLGEDVLSGSLTRTIGEDKGVYEILQGTLSNSNYDIIYSSGSLTILPRTIDISIDNKSVVYGEQEELTYTVADEYKNIITGAPCREENNNVGNYTITKGDIRALSENYTLNFVNEGEYIISPKNIYVVAQSCFKIYGEEDNLRYVSIGLIGEDILSGTLSREAGEDVGEYEINVGSLSNANYTISFVSGTLTIKKACLSVVIDNKTQVYGKNTQKLTYSVLGLVGGDTATIELAREENDNVGTHLIFIKSMTISDNYYLENYPTATYTITKADTTISIKPMTCTYSGKAVEFKDDSGLNLRYVYTEYGNPVVAPINAGVYRVKAYFDGDQNYNSAVSNETTLTILKQNVYIILGTTDFIYDGDVKYPSFSYDDSLGLDDNQFEYDFNELSPIEVGEYEFTIKIKDGLNYAGSASGKVVIKEAFIISTENSVIECDNATFDDDAQKVELVQTTQNEKFNDEKVLSVCSLKSTGADIKNNGYTYTVKVKTTEDITNAKVYRVGANGYQEIALKIEDGYFIFSVDSLEDKYIITTDIKKLSSLAWKVIYAVIALVVLVTVLVVVIKVHKKKKLARVTKSTEPLEEVEDYHVV